MDCGTKSILKAALHHGPVVVLFRSDSMLDGGAVCVSFCCMYENCWLTPAVGNRKAIQDVCGLIRSRKKTSTIVRAVVSQDALDGRIKCPLQRSNLAWASPGWSVWLDHPDWSRWVTQASIVLRWEEDHVADLLSDWFVLWDESMNHRKAELE